jgi:hypothetical protein
MDMLLAKKAVDYSFTCALNIFAPNNVAKLLCGNTGFCGGWFLWVVQNNPRRSPTQLDGQKFPRS